MMCSPGVAGDGTLRCLPHAPTAGLYFQDTGCTDAVRLTPHLDVALDAGSCPTGRSLFHSGAAVDPTLYSVSASDGACVAVPSDASPLYSIGEELPPETFVALELEIE
jgi:hypothetical protein